VCKQRWYLFLRDTLLICSTVVTHCLQWKWVDLVLEVFWKFPAVLSPLGVAFYILIVIWLYSILCGRVPCLVYTVWIYLTHDAYYRICNG
jgi:hypothetical protein